MMDILHLLLYLSSLLPLRLLYFISDLLFIIVYYIVGYRKKVVFDNLTAVFPTHTRSERIKVAKQFYKHLCDLIVEHIKALTITPQQLLQHVDIDNDAMEEIKRFYQQKKSIILVTGHLGNWEWIAHAFALQSAYSFYAAYQPLHNKTIDHIILRLRTRFQRKALPYKTLFKAIDTHNEIKAIALLIDQAPHARGYSTIFLNQPTAMVLSAARIAQRKNYPIWYVAIQKTQRGKYQAKPKLLAVETTALSLETIVTRYTKALEENILANPAWWLWSHKRWK